MAEFLEVAQLVDHNGVPDVQVGRRRVHAELHPQLAAGLQLAGEVFLEDQFLGPALDELEGFGYRDNCGHGRLAGGGVLCYT